MIAASWPPDFSPCDAALSTWASKHDLNIIRDWQGDSDVTRTVWMDQMQVQIWLDSIGTERFVNVNAAQRSNLIQSGRDYSIKFKVPLPRLGEALEVVWKIVQEWN